MNYSMIIPTYNDAVRLRNSLEALKQVIVPEGASFEVIVVDDGSDTDTWAVIGNMDPNYDLEYLYYKRCEVSSRARARNKGIKKASGDILVFVDADIIVPPHYLQELERCYRFDPSCLVAGFRSQLREEVALEDVKSGRVFQKDYQIEKGLEPEERRKIFQDLSYNAGAFRHPELYCLTCNLAAPREAVQACGGFDEDLLFWGVEDIELAFRLARKGIRIFFNDRHGVLHQSHGPVKKKPEQQGGVNKVDYNADVFIKKHPGAFGLPDEQTRELFRHTAQHYTETEPRREDLPLQTVIDFDDPAVLEETKKQILDLLARKDCRITVKDRASQTDLDLWIQSTEQEAGRLKYYPYAHLSGM